MVEQSALAGFPQWIWGFYDRHGRHDLPWRQQVSDYEILVSELMLQQTQVDRVVPKYEAFLKRFPTVSKLSQANLPEVLSMWMGLGYNRRAKFLHETAQLVMSQYKARFPRDMSKLLKLPGIGPYTASAVSVFAFNQPAVVIETNVRQVYLYHFFFDRENVNDADIKELVELTMDKRNPREWYWALMDYGSVLKKLVGNQSVRSKGYMKQSKFEGSNRQLRARILRRLLDSDADVKILQSEFKDERVVTLVRELEKENLIEKVNNLWRIRS